MAKKHSPQTTSMLMLPDPRLDKVEAELRAISGIQARLTDAVARAVDEVVDPIRSARWQIGQLDQPEKTVIGIRVENVLRMEFEFARPAKLDLEIAGQNVDVKFTVRDNWSIPPEAIDEICLLTRYRPSDSLIWVGLLRTTRAVLHGGDGNRDSKRGVNSAGKKQIRWIVQGSYSSTSMVTFMASLLPAIRTQITDPSIGAQARLNRLFSSLKGQPIPETVVEAIAQHKDWTRRLRPDATNRGAPGSDLGFDVLRNSSPTDRKALALANIQLSSGFCMSVDA